VPTPPAPPNGPPEPARVSRRRFVRLGVGGALLLGAGGILAYQTSGYELTSGRSEERRVGEE